MATSAFEAALELAGSLHADEKLQLVRALLTQTAAARANSGARSILELRGLGAEIWGQIDAQDYVNRERNSWNG
jgi:hypothetical protein